MEWRFADDVVLFAQQYGDIVKILKHLQEAAETYCLQLNNDKTKIMTREDWARGRTSAVMGGNLVDILGEREYVKYLGRRMSFNHWH